MIIIEKMIIIFQGLRESVESNIEVLNGKLKMPGKKHLKYIILSAIFTISLLPLHSNDANNAGNQENKKALIYHIVPHHLDQMEDSSYANLLRRSFDEAKQNNPELIIVEIDTPGGELTATLEIKNIIMSSQVPTVCFVNKNAISAGSLIALSCNKLAMSKGSVIGAATPVFIGNGTMKKAPEKVVSATRAAWRSAAQANGKDPEIAEAFVDDSLVLTKKKHGIRKKSGKLLTLTGDESLKLKIADYPAESVEEIVLKEGYSNFAIERKEPTFQDDFLSFFLNPVVSGFLIGLGLLGLLFEVKSPGWGIPGSIGVVFISIYFLSRISAGYSGWEAPALFAFSLFLILLELFVIPGFGIAGILGFLGLLASVLWAYGLSNFEEGLWAVSIALVFTMLGAFVIIKQLPHVIKKGKGIFLADILADEHDALVDALKNIVGSQGTALTDLRPSGIILLEQQRIDAISSGDYIEKNERVSVIAVEGRKVVVEKA